MHLFIVPKGTSASEDGRKVKFDDVPQWVAEAQKFAPDIPVHSLFTKEQYYDLLDEHGHATAWHLSYLPSCSV